MPKLNLTLKCEDVKISTAYRNNLIEVELTNIDSLDTISEENIINNFLDLRLLFDKIIEKIQFGNITLNQETNTKTSITIKI